MQSKNQYKSNASVISSNDALVLLDLNINKKLKSEGIARDMIRIIQEVRKNINLNITDRILVNVECDEKIINYSLNYYLNYIKKQTLSTEIKSKIKMMIR